jgi:uncharacterized protein (TIGR00251 family)
MKDIRNRKDARIGFRVRVQPSAPRSELLGWNTAGELRIKVAAPPRGGEANEELIAFLAKWLGVARRDIIVESGASSRNKVLSAPAFLAQALRALPEI